MIGLLERMFNPSIGENYQKLQSVNKVSTSKLDIAKILTRSMPSWGAQSSALALVQRAQIQHFLLNNGTILGLIYTLWDELYTIV